MITIFVSTITVKNIWSRYETKVIKVEGKNALFSLLIFSLILLEPETKVRMIIKETNAKVKGLIKALYLLAILTSFLYLSTLILNLFFS